MDVKSKLVRYLVLLMLPTICFFHFICIWFYDASLRYTLFTKHNNFITIIRVPVWKVHVAFTFAKHTHTDTHIFVLFFHFFLTYFSFRQCDQFEFNFNAASILRAIVKYFQLSPISSPYLSQTLVRSTLSLSSSTLLLWSQAVFIYYFFFSAIILL